MLILQVEEIPGLGQYDDFHTIDWQRDIARDRTRHRLSLLTHFNKYIVVHDLTRRYIVKKKQESLLDLIRGAHDAWSGAAIKAFLGQSRKKCYLLMERLR